jgi:predicted membrane chloride channel (bestrophin family)
LNREEKIKISYLGIGMIIAGVASIVLYFMSMNLLILAWIDFFGETIGWVFRVLLIIIGLFLFYKFDQADEDYTEERKE